MTNLMEYQQKLRDSIIDKLETSGKAGLELFTSGGKSFIGMSLMEYYIQKYDRDILWIAPKAAMMNVKTRYLDKTQYSHRVHYMSTSMLSRYNHVFADKSLYSNVGLIIIDEAHKLMAVNAYDAYKGELLLFKDIKIFAMTASSFRNLDGIRSLETLVGSDNIFRYSLGEAIDASVANPVKYYGTSVKYNKHCYTAIDKLTEMYGHIPYIRSIIDKAVFELNSIDESLEEKVVKFISNKAKFDCSDGDRHIVFFSRIAELKAKKPLVESIMRRLYDNQATINLIEYHGLLSDRQSSESIQIINSEPIPGVVDVILTVDKGAESIHPENMRSAIVFRSTKSMVKFTQMMGRVITLTVQNNQNNYIFDFCNSMKFLGAETITIGHRRLKERVEYNLESSMTPEELLSDVQSLKKQSNNDKAFEINLDDSVSELNSIFNRLAVMYEIMTNLESIDGIIRNNIRRINSVYNGNIAKFMFHDASEDTYRDYSILQNALLYKGLSEEDRLNIGGLEDKYKHKIYLTLRMSSEDEKLVRLLYKYMRMYSSIHYDESLMHDNAVKELKAIACKLLTDTLAVDVEAFIKQDEALYNYLINSFESIPARTLGCRDNNKRNIAMNLINSVKYTHISDIDRESWLGWKAAGAYLKHVFTEDSFEDSEKLYAIAVLKYVSQLNDGAYTRKYVLTDKEKCVGAKTIRILNNYFRDKDSRISLVDELFLYGLISGKYDSDYYVTSLFRLAGYTSKQKISRDMGEKTRTHELYNEFKADRTEEKLIEVIKFNKEMMLPDTIQKEIMGSKAVRGTLREAGKNGNTALVKYCINRLSSSDKLASSTLKRAALNGLGYGKIISLAFPVSASGDVEHVLSDLNNCEVPSETLVNQMNMLRNTYCRLPFATASNLEKIRDQVIPKRGYGTELYFIQQMIYED